MKKNITGCIVSSVVAFFVGVIGTYLVVVNFNPTTENVIKNIKSVEVVDNSIADAVEKVYDAVVVIEAYNNDTLKSTGTGFVYKKTGGKGYIMTNNHVVDGANNVKIIYSNGTTTTADILGKETYSDIAVLTVKDDTVLSVVSLGDSTKMRLGDTVFTIGSPLGSEYSGTVTRGILSNKDRLVAVSLTSGSTSDWIMKVLQTDAAINPGNSGGPLLNINGEVIGINSLKLVENEIEGMGFAIPIEDAIYYAEILEKGEKISRPYMGIGMLDISNPYSLRYYGINIDSSVTSGVVITEVEKNSPAYKAGLQKGDVIYQINDEDVNSIAEFRYVLYKSRPGDMITLKYYRGADKKSVNVKLVKNDN
ncbi:MAG: S1C family serine protease [Bacilli bacterium]